MTDSFLVVFFSAFLASTLLPGGSEAVLAWVGHGQQSFPLGLLLVATAGNTLGGMTSWLLGRWLVERPRLQRFDPRHHAASARVQRWGAPVLLLSWLPVLGDPLCLAAGWLRIGLWPALFFIALGKGLRYAAVLALVSGAPGADGLSGSEW